MAVELSVVVVRLVLGLLFLAHGFHKVFGWFGGPGLANWNRGQAARGVRPAWLWGGTAAIGDLVVGVCVLLGFLTPMVVALVVSEMLAAILLAHRPIVFWNRDRGVEYPLVLIGMATALGLSGSGPASLDTQLGVNLSAPVAFLVATTVAVLGVIIMMATRGPEVAGPPTPGAPAHAASPGAPHG